MREPALLGVWQKDIRYYLACGLFDGRRPPDSHRLSRFRKNTNAGDTSNKKLSPP